MGVFPYLVFSVVSRQGGGHAVYCYARVLLDLVGDGAEDAASEIKEVLHALGEVDVREFFINPVVAKEQRVGVLRDVCKACAVSDVLASFICVVIADGKFPILPEILEEFSLLLMKREGRFNLEIISAAPMTEGEEQRVLSMLEEYGKPESIERRIDPEILGGFIARGDSFLVDASVSGHLSRLHKVSREVILNS